MNETVSLRRRALGFAFEIRSDVFPGEALFSDLESATDGEEPRGIIEVYRARETFKEDRDINWISLYRGRFAYEGDFALCQIDNYIFEISVRGQSVRLEIPLDFGYTRPPVIPMELALMMFLRSQGFIPLHASGGRLNAGILFGGRTGCGKSTLAYNLFESGGRVLSDDRVFLYNLGGEVWARSYDRGIMLQQTNSVEGEHKTLFNPEEVREGSIISQMRPDSLIFPEFSAVDEPALQRIAASEAAIRLLSLTLPPKEVDDARIVFNLCRQCSLFVIALPESGPQFGAVQNLLAGISSGDG